MSCTRISTCGCEHQLTCYVDIELSPWEHWIGELWLSPTQTARWNKQSNGSMANYGQTTWTRLGKTPKPSAAPLIPEEWTTTTSAPPHTHSKHPHLQSKTLPLILSHSKKMKNKKNETQQNRCAYLWCKCEIYRVNEHGSLKWGG